jgi:hypothetical protein
VVDKGPPLTTLNEAAVDERALDELDDEEVTYVTVVEIIVDVRVNDAVLLNSAASDAATSLGSAEFRTDIAFVVVGASEVVIVVLWLLDEDVIVVDMTACAAA